MPFTTVDYKRPADWQDDSVIKALEKHFLTTVMHLQQKTEANGEDGAKAKGILKNLQANKFVKFTYFLLDVMMSVRVSKEMSSV